jgi:diguanylate cyclase (GGDEF)-like protein
LATLLVIDDSDTQREQIRSALEPSGLFSRILEAGDGLAGLKLLMAEPIDVVLCDLEMPRLDGDKLLRMKDCSPGGANIPFVYLTASTNLDRKVRLILEGASDAIAKPFHPPDLVARLKLHLKVKRLQDELMLKNATLERLSTVDGLTGLRTRRYVDEVLSVEFLRARRYRTPLCVLMIDLDEFKEVNDALGHLAGDAVLCGAAQRIQSMVRSTDVAGRYGGDEFIIVQPQNRLEGARVMAERLRAAIAGEPFEIERGRPVSLTLSIGVAECHDGLETPDELLAAADRALYEAKRGGRNRVAAAPGPGRSS